MGGSYIPGDAERVVYPRGYFARPVTPMNTAEDAAVLDCAMRLMDPPPVKAGEPPREPTPMGEFAGAIRDLARVLFEAYYGEEVLRSDILPRLPVSNKTLEELALAALGSAPYRLVVKK